MIVFGKALKFINVQGINPPPELCSRKIICIIKIKRSSEEILFDLPKPIFF